MCVGDTLNMDSCCKFWGDLEGIRGNPGEIPHNGWKIPRVYRVKTHKGNEIWPLFVNKQLFCWSASITLDNNNAVLTDL